MTFGEKLRELREKNNLTQKDLGEKIGVSARLVSYYETNKTIPNDPDILNGISSLFDVTLDYLLGTADESESKLHKLVRKLIDVTQKRRLNWGHFFSSPEDYCEQRRLNAFDSYASSKLSNGDCTIIEDESFFTEYNNGGYLLIRIFQKGSNTYRTELLVYFNEFFTFYACDKDIELIEDLFITVKNQVLGIESFVDDFLEDNFLEDDLPF